MIYNTHIKQQKSTETVTERGRKSLIATLTMNTAIDRLLFIDRFSKNNTNRINRVTETLGGKGTHVSLNLDRLGLKNDCYGVVMGQTGKRVTDILKRYSNINVKMYYQENGETRTNYALIENDHSCTLITEKGKTISKDICNKVVNMLKDSLVDEDDLVLSGDASNTEIPNIYNYIMEKLSEKKIRVYLDTSSENLINGIKLKPFMVKPNLEELSQYVGKKVESREDILQGMKEIINKGVSLVAVTCGEDGSYVYYQNQFYRIEPLKIKAVNTIGCGDAYLSGIIYGINSSMDFEDVLSYASAVSAATALSDLTVGFDLIKMKELLTHVIIKRL